MSAISWEEIEREVSRTAHYFSRNGMIRDEDAAALCERVAALVEERMRSDLEAAREAVEERMKEMVCSGCGVERSKHAEAYDTPIIERWDGNPNHSPEADKCGDWITRAQYEAEKEGQ